MLDVLRQGLEQGPWILGERFSAADVLLGTSCQFLLQFKAIPGDARLEAYVERCHARPAYLRAAAAELA